MRTHGQFSREAEDRVERVCGGIVGFMFGAIALGTPAKDHIWLVLVVGFVVVPLVLWRGPGNLPAGRASSGGPNG